jgi:hypothetical protein
MRIFENHQASWGLVNIIRPDRSFNIAEIKGAVRLVGDCVRVDPTQGSHPSTFKQEGMPEVPHDGLIPTTTVGQHSEQVPHRARWDK